MNFVIRDDFGKQLIVGSPVHAGKCSASRWPPGIVVDITEPDGDWDDLLGRPVEIPPMVNVKWPDGEKPEAFSAYFEYTPHIEDKEFVYTCGDLRLLGPEVSSK